MAIDAAGRLDGLLVLDVEALLDQPRLRPVGDGRVQDRVGRFQVLFHQEGGNVQRLGPIVEAVGRRVRRQQVFQIDVHAQQVAHGVLVLGPVEPAQDDPPLRRHCGRCRRLHPPANPVRQGWTSSAGGRGFSFGGMAPDLDLLQHGQPAFAIGLVAQVRGEAAQAEVALGLVPGMAGLAVLRQEKPGRLDRGFGVWFSRPNREHVRHSGRITQVPGRANGWRTACCRPRTTAGDERYDSAAIASWPCSGTPTVTPARSTSRSPCNLFLDR